jgi:queuine/archaeosine tRNA-ribosyltransferase
VLNKLQAVDYVIGDQMNSRFINVYEAFRNEYFIFSVYPFYSSVKKQEQLKALGIHKFVDHPGKILLDSGGFQLITKNKTISPDETLNLYKLAKLKKGDNGICLDYCPRCDEPAAVRIQKIKKTNENYKYMFEQNKKVVHVVHGWTQKEIELSISGFLDSEIISYGSCFTMLAMNSAFDELLGSMSVKDLLIKRFMIFMDLLKKNKLEDVKIHILGASSGNASHVMWYSGMDQCDSSNWRIKAAYGKISFPGFVEVKISKRESTFGNSVWKPIYSTLLKECECPVCKHLSLLQKKELLAESFQARCVHNAYVYLQERQLARDMLGTTRYLPYLEKRFERSYFWKKFLKHITEGRSQKDLNCYLGGLN